MQHLGRAACVVVMAVSLTGCASLGGAPTGEVAELATMGSQRPLRDPMHPIRGGTRVLVFALDGVGADELMRAVAEDRLPSLARVMGAEPGGGFRHAFAGELLSVLPSSTTPGWASIFTGEPPARTGIPGNEWFDRGSLRFYAPVPVSVSRRSDAIRVYTDELMSELVQVPTVHEEFGGRIHVSLLPVFRGADLLTMPNMGSVGDLTVALGESVLKGGSTRSPAVFRETDLKSVGPIGHAFHGSGVPDLQIAYFPGIDLYTHQSQDPIEAQQRYLADVTDRAIGEILGFYEERGLLDSTFVVVISDHGHTRVLNDDRHSLHVDGDDEPGALIHAAGFRLRPHSLSTEAEDFQAVLALQGGMAFVYLADRSTCPAAGDRCDWSRPPRLREDVLALARAFHEANEHGAAVPELQGTLDLILARPGSTADGEPGPFGVYDGERLVPLSEFLKRNPRPDLVDLERRLEWLAVGEQGHRAGEILLLPRFGEERPIEERFYFGTPYWSEHGSAHGKDSRVPLIVAHPRFSGEELGRMVGAALGDEPTQLGFAGLLRVLLER